MRSIYFGTDVIHYINKFEMYRLIPIERIIPYLKAIGEKDTGFYVFGKIISLFSDEYRLWLFVLAAIYIILNFYIINLYSKGQLISILLFISLGFLFFSMTGLRQATAMAILTLSYKYLRETKLVKFILLVLVASLFHISALIFLIAIPLLKLKTAWSYFFILIVGIIINLNFLEYMNTVISLFPVDDVYSGYFSNEEKLSFSGFFIQVIIFLFCLAFRKNLLKHEEKDRILYNLVLVGLIFQLFSTNIAVLFRISMYFSFFSIILVPNVIYYIQNKYLKMSISFLLIIVAIAYTIYSGYYNSFSLINF